MKTVTTSQLDAMIADDREIAVLDVREQGQFAAGHLLLSNCLPLSRMELDLADLIPRRGTRIVVVGGGPSDPHRAAERAAERLAGCGYEDVSVLAGGIEGWQKSGRALFSGVNTLSKAFGEYIESTCATPHIGAEALHAKIESGEDLLIFDARPAQEYRRMNIPGAVNVPGAELVHRFFESVERAETLVVVNCAGRTRSIIGAQSLINAGVPNRVLALQNGTMGWHLAGFDLEYGQRREAPPPSGAAAAKARDCARRVADRFGVSFVDRARLARWRQDEAGTLYVLDVRTPEEFAAGRLAGSRNAPGGQLVQATDEYVAVRKARIVLLDDTETRAIMTASWLIQMGWANVYVLAEGIGTEGLERGLPVSAAAALERLPEISAAELKAQLAAGGMAVVDVGDSRIYREAHIPGAYWVVRSRMALDLAPLAHLHKFVLSAPDDRLAHLAAADLRSLRPDATIRVLEGGKTAWLKAGFPAEKGMSAALSKSDDVWYKPYERPDARENAMREYLRWEVGLVEKLMEDGSVAFPRF